MARSPTGQFLQGPDPSRHPFEAKDLVHGGRTPLKRLQSSLARWCAGSAPPNLTEALRKAGLLAEGELISREDLFWERLFLMALAGRPTAIRVWQEVVYGRVPHTVALEGSALPSVSDAAKTLAESVAALASQRESARRARRRARKGAGGPAPKGVPKPPR